MADKADYWFPMKKYGWGWGTPRTWQGWAVLIVYVALMLAGIAFLNPGTNAPGFIAYAVFLSVVLSIICWVKGERPRWRWRDSDA